MATFYQANVTATNGSAFVTVNSSGDDIGILRERSLLQIDTNRIVEVKAGIPGSPDQIELAAAWPFATVTADAIAAPTAGDLAEAVEQIRALTSQGSTILADALLKSGNLAGLANAAAARGNLGLEDAATRTVMASLTDTTPERLMPVGAFGVGADKGVLISSYNLNHPVQSIRYRADQVGGTGPEDVAYSHSGVISKGVTGKTVLVARETGNPAQQRAWVGANSSDVDALIWSEIYTNNSILGTVSQSGGVPTGAIIERGSNANGEYVKFADGSLFMSRIAVPDWTGTSVQSFSLPASPVGGRDSVFGGFSGMNSGGGDSVPNAESIRNHGVTDTSWFLLSDGTGINGSGDAYEVKFFAMARWF